MIRVALRPLIALLCASCALALFAGCASRPKPRYWTLAEVLELNQGRLAKLERGMAKQDALVILGSETFHGTTAGTRFVESRDPSQPAYGPLDHSGNPGSSGQRFERQRRPIRNPYRKASHRDKDGHWIEVFFYVSDDLGSRDRISDHELTPVIFRKDRLAGWGWELMTELTGVRPRS